MAKRRAASQLTRDDLDRLDNEQEEDIDTGGEGNVSQRFASPDILSQRKMAKARRSIPASDTAVKSPFAGIQLQAPSVATPFGGSSLFPSFGQQQQTSMKPSFGFGLSTQKQDEAQVTKSSLPLPTLTNGMKTTVDKESEADKDFTFSGRSMEYWAKIERLNSSFVDHLTEYVKDHPRADFRINCEEYIKHLSKLDQDYPLDQQTTSSSSLTVSSSKTTSTTATSFVTPVRGSSPGFSFGPSDVQARKESVSTPTFGSGLNGTAFNTSTPSFGFKTGATAPLTFPSIPATSNTSTPMFHFGGKSDTGITPSSVATNSQATDSVDDDCAEYIPPKNEDIKADEEGSVYSKKIKLYFRKEKKYEALGRAWMHIKPLDSGKNQLLVRAENSIGTILLNVLLSSQLPLNRMKKDVILSAMTKDPGDPKDDNIKSVCYLIRTVSESDAQEVETKIKEYKS